MATKENFIGKVVKLEMPLHSRKIRDEKYLKRNSYYLVEDQKQIRYKNGGWGDEDALGLKLKGINGYRVSVIFKIVPDAIIRDLRIESVLKRTKKDIIVQSPIGHREIDNIKDKNPLLIKLILEELISTKYGKIKYKAIEEIIDKIITNDIFYAFKIEDFAGIKDMTFGDLVTQFSF